MLKFNVRNQTINRVDNFRPAEKSIAYLLAMFDFKTEDWSNKIKTAVFENAQTGQKYDQMLDENICVVPWEALADSGECKVSVYGVKDGVRITTNIAGFNLDKTIFGGSGTQEPSQTVYEQILHKMEHIDGGSFTDWKE